VIKVEEDLFLAVGEYGSYFQSDSFLEQKKPTYVHMGSTLGGGTYEFKMYFTEHAQFNVIVQEGKKADMNISWHTLLLFSKRF
jgi:hypothetical protein